MIAVIHHSVADDCPSDECKKKLLLFEQQPDVVASTAHNSV